MQKQKVRRAAQDLAVRSPDKFQVLLLRTNGKLKINVSKYKGNAVYNVI